MLIRKTMTNMEIFNIASKLLEVFKEEDSNNFPVKVNFFLQKNITSITTMAQELEKSRIEIIQKFGKADPEDSEKIVVPADKIEEATKELEDLFSLEQEVPTNMLKLEWFDGIDMTAAQVAAISYMIEDEE